jgi:hypothetical protein
LRILDGFAVTKILYKRAELTADWRRLRNEDADTLYCLTGMIRFGGGHVACIEKARNIYIAKFE